MKIISILILTLLFLTACGGEADDSDLIEFLSPLPDQSIAEGEAFAVEVGAVNEAEVARIDLYIDGVYLRGEQIIPWQWSLELGDVILQTLLPGRHELRAEVTTTAGETYGRSTFIEVIPAEFRVTGLSLVDVDLGTNVANYDPIYMGEEVPINLDDLAIQQFSFIAGHEGVIGSVVFSVNGAVYRTDNAAPFAITQNTGAAPLPLNLSPGSYEISAVPYTQINGGGEAGPGKTVRVLMQKSILQWSTQQVRLISELNSGQPAVAEITVQNTGNIASSVEVANKPAWLEVSNTGEVPAGGERVITLSAAACSQITEATGTLTLNSNRVSSSEVEVIWSCDDRPAFDLALERFYFNQVVPQNDTLEGSDGSKVDLITGRQGLARAFVTRNNSDSASVPTVELHYRLASGATGVYTLQKSGSVPTSVDESSLGNSFNLLIPAEFFQEGTEYFVVVDPSNQINENTDTNNRYPESGYQTLSIVSPSVMELVFVPLFVPGNPEFTLTESDVHELMATATVFLPISEYSFSIREPASYNGTSWTEAVQLINTIRYSEDPNKFYHGIVNGRIGDSNVAGIAQVAAKSGLSIPDPGTIAHELGHNLSMSHTDCGGPDGPEPDYPYANARTGSWGYDIAGQRLMSPDRADFMSYCYPVWVGSFSFQKMVHYFAKGQNPGSFQFFTPVMNSPTIISGSINGGNAAIDQTFDVNGDVTIVVGDTLPYRLSLFDDSGAEIYSTGFQPQVLDHSNSLLFEIPVERSLLADDTWHVKIFYEDQLLLSEPWRAKLVFAQSLNLTEQVQRTSEELVKITWGETNGYTLWVRDPQTGKILGMNSSGSLTLQTELNTLELTYVKQSQKVKRVVEVSGS